MIEAEHRSDGFGTFSDFYFSDGDDRLVSQNGVLDGPRRGACGQRYLAAPEELLLNDMNRRASGSPSVRVIHKPCERKKGARFTVGLPHGRQKKSSDNIRIARSITTSGGVLDIWRIIDGIDMETRCEINRICDRTYWLEEVMLAHEQAQLAKWRDRLAKDATPARSADGGSGNDLIIVENTGEPFSIVGTVGTDTLRADSSMSIAGTSIRLTTRRLARFWYR